MTFLCKNTSSMMPKVLASTAETAELQKTIAPILQRQRLADDPDVATALRELPADASSSLTAEIRLNVSQRDTGTAGQSATTTSARQREWSRAYDTTTIQARIDTAAGTDPTAKARLMSCAGSHQALHPLMPTAEDGFVTSPWLRDDQMAIVARLRVGEPLYNGESPCVLCRGRTVCDDRGRHAVVCMAGGERIRLHNGARDDFARLGAAALAQPRVEAACFPATAPNRRCDVLLAGLLVQGRPSALDYACIAHSDAAAVRDAAASVGGAATAYEAEKRRSYAQHPQAAGLTLVPVIQDFIGAYGAAALGLINLLARRIADRHGLFRAVVLRQIRTVLMANHYRRLANLLLVNNH